MPGAEDIKFTPRPDEEVAKGPRKIYTSLVAVVIVAVLIIVMAIPTMQQAGEEEKVQLSKEVELSETILQLLHQVEDYAYNNATEMISNSEGEDIQEIQHTLNNNINDFLRFYKFDPYPYFIQNSQISIKKKGEIKLNVEEGLAPVLVPNYRVNPENMGTGANGTIDCRIPLIRQYQPSPVFIKLSGQFLAVVDGPEISDEYNHTFSKRLPYPLPFIERSQDMFESEGQGREGVMSRMVNYMLTTVCRYRLIEGVGYGMDANESPRNVLNEGDVELAVNIALLLLQMKVFGNYDHAVVDAVDEYFFNASQIAARSRADVYNPTGRRPWGEGETQNYIERYYPAREDINYLGRTLDSLVKDFCFKGLIDPADIMALYLCLDQQPIPFSMLINPTDMYSVLYNNTLLNARFANDFFDVVNQEIFLDLSREQQLEFKTLGPDRDEDYTDRLNVDQSPDYLIVGRDIHVDNIYPPKAWYTNVVMCREEYLWAPVLGTGTRCAEYPPGQRPPDHDFRYYWDMDVNLKFNLKISENRDVYIGAYLTSGCTVDRYVEMDFPVQVFLFWDSEIPRNDALLMENLNEGGMIVTPDNKSKWFITSEADAMEYFSKHAWQNLRPYNSLNMDELVSIEGAFRTANKRDATSVSEFTKVLTDALYWKGQKAAELFRDYISTTDADFMKTPYFNFYRFINYYLLYWNITTDDLKPMIQDGLNVTTDYNEISDTLKVFIRHPSATFILAVSNVRNNATRDVSLRTNIDIEGLQLDVEYRPLTSSLPIINEARLFDAFDLTPLYAETLLSTTLGLDPVVAVTECYGINLGGLDLEEGQQSSMDSRFVIPTPGMDTQPLQDLVDKHLVQGSDAVQLSVLLDAVTSLASEHVQDTNGFFPLGFENINHGYSLRLMLNTTGMSQPQAMAAQKDLLGWAAKYGPRIFYMLGNQVGSLEAYRAFMEEGLSQSIRESIMFIMAKPYEEDRLYSLRFQEGLEEFTLIPDGFYRQDTGEGPALLYGIGTEGEHFAATEQLNILKGQFIKGDTSVRSGLVAT